MDVSLYSGDARRLWFNAMSFEAGEVGVLAVGTYTYE